VFVMKIDCFAGGFLFHSFMLPIKGVRVVLARPALLLPF
jgi:hypothetical protein